MVVKAGGWCQSARLPTWWRWQELLFLWDVQNNLSPNQISKVLSFHSAAVTNAAAAAAACPLSPPMTWTIFAPVVLTFCFSSGWSGRHVSFITHLYKASVTTKVVSRCFIQTQSLVSEQSYCCRKITLSTGGNIEQDQAPMGGRCCWSTGRERKRSEGGRVHLTSHKGTVRRVYATAWGEGYKLCSILPTLLMTLLRRFCRSRRRLYQPSDKDVTRPSTHTKLSISNTNFFRESNCICQETRGDRHW